MNKLKLLSSSFIMALTLAAPFATYAMEPDEKDHGAVHASSNTPRHFVRPAYLRTVLDLDQPILEAIYHHTAPLRQFERFLTGKLIYKPDPNSDEGMVVMPIVDLPNPLDGEFDLSDKKKFGDIGERISINTGYRKGKRLENNYKVEIWFAPHFIIKKNLSGSASHFKDIMGSWNASTAPVGTFFTWGDWDDLRWYEYATKLTWASYNDPGNNLTNISEAADRLIPPHPLSYLIHTSFSCHFMPLATYAMEPKEEDHPPAHASSNTPRHFVRPAYLRILLDLNQPILEAIYHQYAYHRFLNGKLIYKPDPNSKEGMVVMPIADLLNPLDGEFDLSKCGDTTQYLSINTGYRKGKRPENAKKLEIWFAPHFLIEKNLAGSASHFKGITGTWDALTAPVGIFWTWGNWDNLDGMDYLTTQSLDVLSDSKNLYELYRNSISQYYPQCINYDKSWHMSAGGRFQISFLSSTDGLSDRPMRFHGTMPLT